MADNVTVSNVPLTDYAVATDEAAGGHVQYIKLMYGADGTFTIVEAGTGLPIVGATGSALLGVAEDAALAGNLLRLGVRAHTGAITAVSADNDIVTPAADRKGQQFILPGKASTATLSNVSDSASSVSLLAATATRLGVILHNDSASYLYLKYGATASTSSYSYKIDPYGHWEMPDPIFPGAIDGIWSADTSGAARITELTP